jgi:hypothetical protein
MKRLNCGKRPEGGALYEPANLRQGVSREGALLEWLLFGKQLGREELDGTAILKQLCG